ncbi:nuclear transport factor 2 family protein [Novosphingobium terrae]|uniref:nuclear transport factor 2 family protein n=1 Tax=Novosphingobium terrae TaxID=2726189 RepID=UPI001F143B25|nr:nuclear transport factor 2 family protein [Novosphingobium terrae]
MTTILQGTAARRGILQTGVLGAALALAPGAAAAQSDAPSAKGETMPPADLLDSYAVTQLLLRERYARETRDGEAEAACFWPDAEVEVSWFKGKASDFVAIGAQGAAAAKANGTVSFDSMSPPVVWVKGDRAIADSSCAVHSFILLDGVEASMTGYTRLLWRARREKGEWRLAGLRGIYIRDTLEACNPAQVPVIDVKKLAQYRPSYRHLSYALAATGRTPRMDLPGVDQPEVVAAMRAAEQAWLDHRA